MHLIVLPLIVVAAAWMFVVARRAISGARFNRDLRASAGLAAPLRSVEGGGIGMRSR
jgi:hypothetical protein